MWHNAVEEPVRIISHNSVNNLAVKNHWNEMYGVEEEEEGTKDGYEGSASSKTTLPCNNIAALERRLNISLPNDYKDFLEITNGMGASWGGIKEEAPLFPASELRWTTKEEEYFTDLTADILVDIFNFLREIYDNKQWPTVGTLLEIGCEDMNKVWLLPRPKVKEIVSVYLNQRG